MSEYDFDPDLKPLLAALPNLEELSTPEKIQESRDWITNLLGEPQDRDDVVKEDRRVPGPKDAPEVPIRIYRPKAEAENPRSCVLEIHGGGFIIGNIGMMDGWCQVIAAEVDTVVVSVEYRLAPENPFPAGLEDCYAMLSWIEDNASSLGIDTDRIAVAGQSAGGGLAAAVALLARDRGGPKLCFQLLEIPELDDRLETASMRAFTDTPMWNRPNAEWSWRHYLGSAHGGDVSQYAAPSRAKDLKGLPPAYVSTMEFDPLRDEGILYALGMLEAGVSVELHSYAGTFHGSGMVPNAEPSMRNAKEVTDLLKRRLGAR